MGREYVMVNDFIGQGGTLANLHGWVEKQGGRVGGAVVLTGKPYSAILTPSKEQLHELRNKHGRDFEKWWRKHFGHAFNCLAQSEARYLARSPDVDAIRDRLAAAQCAGDSRGCRPNPREQRRRVNNLRKGLADQFPAGGRATPNWERHQHWRRRRIPCSIPVSLFSRSGASAHPCRPRSSSPRRCAAC